jgi:hypothetical protein
MELKRYFGTLFSGVNTNLAQLENQIGIFDNIIISAKLFSETLALFNQFEEYDNKLQEILGNAYAGIETNWEPVDSLILWAEKLNNCKIRYKLNDEFIEKICSDATISDVCRTYFVNFKTKADDLTSSYNWFISLFEKNTFARFNLTQIQSKVSQCRTNMQMLNNWIDYKNARDK